MTNEQPAAGTVQNKVEYGFRNLVTWPIVKDGSEDGVWEWGSPIRALGTVKSTLAPAGTSSTMYAEDGDFFSSAANNGYEGDLELANFPDEFYIAYLGYKRDERGGIAEDARALPKPFAMAYEVQGDAKQRRNIFYHCTPSRTSGDDKTIEESISPETKKCTVKCKPVKIGNMVTPKYSLYSDTADQEAWESFYQTPCTPKFTATEPTE